MSKKKLCFVSIMTVAVAVPSFVLLASNQKEAIEADAYTASSVPKVINLNDCDEQEIDDYYQGINPKLKGTDLLIALKETLKYDQKYYNYDSSNNSIWKMYEISDRDWEKSPASALPASYGYDPTTNIISNYVYGSSNSSKGSDPYVHALYINRNVDNESKAWGNHNQDMWGINREHIWAKANGFESTGAGGARGDPMHLWASNGYANNIHGKDYFGYVDTKQDYTDCGTTYSNQHGNLRGTSKTMGSGTVFEPQDSDKGDIARAIFYMAARYNYLSGSDEDGIDSNNPNLELVQEVRSEPAYNSSTTLTGKMGIISDLLEWNKLDPVDEYESHRNNLLYRNFTNNRNPFIDHPEWADKIWGTPTEAVLESISYDSFKSEYFVGDAFVKPTITAHFDDKSTEIVTGDCTFSGYDLSTAGSQTVNVSYTYNDVTVETSFNITVTAIDLKSISVEEQTTTFYMWDEFVFDGKVIGTNNDGTTVEIPVDDVTISAPNMNKDGTQNIDVSYIHDGNKLECSYTITILLPTLLDIEVTPNTVEFTVGDKFVFDGEVTAYFNNCTKTVNPTSVIAPDMNETGTYDVQVYYEFGSKTIMKTYEITIKEEIVPPTLIEISLSDIKTEYEVGDAFVKPTVTAYFDDDTEVDVTEEATFTGYDMSTAGSYTVTVSYLEENAFYVINVKEHVDPPAPPVNKPVSIAVSNVKSEYYVDDEFVKPTVIATYEDGTTKDVSASATFTNYDMSKIGSQTVNVSYTEEETTVSTNFVITISRQSIIPTGCAGNITTTSVIVSFLALVGIAGLLFSKRKKHN